MGGIVDIVVAHNRSSVNDTQFCVYICVRNGKIIRFVVHVQLDHTVKEMFCK